MMYYGAWGVYLATALTLTGAWWYCTRGIGWGFVRGTLRWTVACLLLVPARGGLETVLLAPAWVVVAFGLAEDGREVTMLGARPLAAALAVGIAVVLVASLVRLVRPAHKAAPERRAHDVARERPGLGAVPARRRRKPARRRRR